MLRIRGLRVAYGKALVLDGIDLDVEVGESVALKGRNGMGKTTLIRAISGIRPPTVIAGTIELDGADITARTSHRIARAGIGLVPQGRQVFGSLSVRENLAIVPHPAESEWTIERVFGMFPRLEERSRSAARTLSGGEQQMLAIGRALMTAPSLLVLAPAVLRVIEERLQVLRESGLAVLVAEQNVDLALALGDRVLILGEAGRIAWEGTPDDLAADPRPVHQYLGL
jgi:branched-chain amino acid transport system ATP-binding protein